MSMPAGVRSCPCLVIAGTSSGVGKTTFTAALARALTLRGLRVQTFKCGPDYLDPTYHQKASGRTCHNLDPWLMGEAALRTTFALATQNADIALVEGVMGLFDGRDPETDESSTAHVAKLLGASVLLVADASGMARSFAALVHGYRNFDPALRVVGALANRVGSPAHGSLLARVLPADLAYFWLARDPALAFCERHLGLVRAADEADEKLTTWAQRIDRELDVGALLALARPVALDTEARRTQPLARRCRIGVAQDAAFHFYYPFNLHLLEAAGAELVHFSPLHDAALPPVDGLYIGGGYPELFADKLGPTSPVGRAVRDHAAAGKPVYAECGGLMWLTRALTALDGHTHPMLGLVDAVVTMQPKRQALGYAEVATKRATLLGPAGRTLYGHEYRYSTLTPADAGEGAYLLKGRRGAPDRTEGYGGGNVLASYVHLHWGRTPEAAAAFVARCMDGKARTGSGALAQLSGEVERALG
jgi:cobyrinic acid a,c-diamide synthase